MPDRPRLDRDAVRPAPQPEAARPDQDWLRRLAGYCWRHRRDCLISVTAGLATSLLTVTLPLIQRACVDDAITPDSAPVLLLAVALLLCVVLRFGSSRYRRVVTGRLSLAVQHDLRTTMLRSLSRLDGRQQDNLSTAQGVSRSISDLTMVQSVLQMTPLAGANLLLFVMSLAVMIVLSPPLALVAIAAGPGLGLIAYHGRKRQFAAGWDAQQRLAGIAGAVEAAVTGVRVVKGFGQEERELDRLDRAAAALYGSRLRVVRYSSRYVPLMQAIPALGQVGVLALGGYLAYSGQITLGTFLAFATYLVQLAAPLSMLVTFLSLVQQAKASVIRVFEVIDARPLITEGEDASPLPDGPLRVELSDVTFGYSDSTPVLRGLSLTVPPGQTLALVGPSGAGKSTIAWLLLRFYDADGGTVTVGGHDVRTLTFDSLRRAVGLVQDDTFLYSATVLENIAFGRPDADESQITRCAKAAQAHDFICELPDGYDTVLGERGLTLSGGQRQRIALARALLADPAVLILDDATSAVDPKAEAELLQALRDARRGRSTILIAHRRATINLADRIAVLQDGRVIDIGTHDELLARCLTYRRLLAADDKVGAQATGTIGAARTANGTAHRGAHSVTDSAPEMNALVAALRPVRDTPGLDPVLTRTADPGFTLPRLLAPFRGTLLAGLMLVSLDAVAQLTLPALLRSGIDHGIVVRDASDIVTVSVLGLMIVVADWAVNVAQTWVSGRGSERVLYTLRVKAFAHLQRLSLDYYERELPGHIMTRMTTDIDALAIFLETSLITGIVSLLTFGGILVALMILDIRLSLVALAVAPLAVVATVVFRSRSARAYAVAREKVSAVNAHFQESVAGLRTTQMFRQTVENNKRFTSLSEDYRADRYRAQKYIAQYFPFVQLLSDLSSILVILIGVRLIRENSLSVGVLIAYILYIDMAFSPIQQLSQVFDSYQQAVVGMKRVRDLLRTTVGTPVPARPRPVPLRLRGEIAFSGVHFSYPGATSEALRGIDLTVSAGETVALVGHSGAGKSSLIKLAARFYDATAGQVLIDGVDIREYDLTALRQRLGIVPQEAHLFEGTVRDTIAYARPAATDAQVEAAARAVGAHETIMRLPDDYLHPVARRGGNLSSGQRQLLALARAELVDPDILLLDEATAALDLATETAISIATESLTRPRTTLVVAHRLTTAARADRIVVLDHGLIAEQGTHAALLSAAGPYARLWESFTADKTEVPSLWPGSSGR